MDDLDITADVDLDTLKVTPGGSVTLTVSISLPKERPWVKVFLRLSPILSISPGGRTVFYPGKSYPDAPNPDVPPSEVRPDGVRPKINHSLYPSGDFSGHSTGDLEWDWGADSHCLLADIPASGIWDGEKGVASLFLEWSVSIVAAATAKIGSVGRIKLDVLADQKDVSLTKDVEGRLTIIDIPIQPTELPSPATLGGEYHVKFKVEKIGGSQAAVFSTQHELPQGMTLTPAGLLSGAPETYGDFPLSINVKLDRHFRTYSYVLHVVEFPRAHDYLDQYTHTSVFSIADLGELALGGPFVSGRIIWSESESAKAACKDYGFTLDKGMLGFYFVFREEYYGPIEMKYSIKNKLRESTVATMKITRIPPQNSRENVVDV
ncbi:hypothetical protein [Burkholderia ambifaria]|nr:hypothetical protein [Burkholderia ambifaria]